MDNLIYVDVETDGVRPDAQVWEIALIEGANDREHVYHLEIDLSKAETQALRLNRYYERRYKEDWSFIDPKLAALQVATLTAGKVLVGAIPWFDSEKLERFLRSNGQAPSHDYHLVDIESYVAGAYGLTPPWKLSSITRAAGLNPEAFDSHTALGDARLVKALYERVRRKYQQ